MHEFIGNIFWIFVAMIGSGAGYTIVHKLTRNNKLGYLGGFVGFIAAVVLFVVTR